MKKAILMAVSLAFALLIYLFFDAAPEISAKYADIFGIGYSYAKPAYLALIVLLAGSVAIGLIKATYNSFMKGKLGDAVSIPVIASLAIYATALFGRDVKEFIANEFPATYEFLIAVSIMLGVVVALKASSHIANVFCRGVYLLCRLTFTNNPTYHIGNVRWMIKLSPYVGALMSALTAIALFVAAFDIGSGGSLLGDISKSIAENGYSVSDVLITLFVIGAIGSISTNFLIGVPDSKPIKTATSVFLTYSILIGCGVGQEGLDIYSWLLTAYALIVTIGLALKVIAIKVVASHEAREKRANELKSKLNAQETPVFLVADEFGDLVIRGGKNFQCGDDDFWGNRKDDRL